MPVPDYWQEAQSRFQAIPGPIERQVVDYQSEEKEKESEAVRSHSVEKPVESVEEKEKAKEAVVQENGQAKETVPAQKKSSAKGKAPGERKSAAVKGKGTKEKDAGTGKGKADDAVKKPPVKGNKTKATGGKAKVSEKKGIMKCKIPQVPIGKMRSLRGKRRKCRVPMRKIPVGSGASQIYNCFSTISPRTIRTMRY
jgi:hypothetical protein